MTSSQPSAPWLHLGGIPSFGFNFDPSHLIHQFIDPVEFIDAFSDRIFHVHVEGLGVRLNGRTSILALHLDFGDPRRDGLRLARSR